MRDPFYHLPFALVLFIVLVTGATDLGLGAEPKVLVTLLAPVLWLGLYLLFGADHRKSSRGGDPGKFEFEGTRDDSRTASEE